MQKLVSVIIPFYNSCLTLERSIQSILSQDYTRLEVILIDDCSTDCSTSIALKYSSRYRNIRFYQNKTNLGVSCSRNIGAKLSRGELISFLDSDDYYISNSKISNSVSLIEKYFSVSKPSQIVCASRSVLYNPNTNKFTRLFPLFSCLPFNFFVYTTLMPRDLILSRTHFFSIGGFDESTSLYEDWLFRLRLAQSSRFVLLPTYDSVYTYGDSGLSKSTNTLNRLCLEFNILYRQLIATYGFVGFLIYPIYFICLLLYHFYVFLLVRRISYQ